MVFYCFLLYILFFFKNILINVKRMYFSKKFIKFQKINVYITIIISFFFLYNNILITENDLQNKFCFSLKVLVNPYFSKNVLTFRRLFFKSTKEKMQIGRENRKLFVFYCLLLYILFLFKNIFIKC